MLSDQLVYPYDTLEMGMWTIYANLTQKPMRQRKDHDPSMREHFIFLYE